MWEGGRGVTSESTALFQTYDSTPLSVVLSSTCAGAGVNAVVLSAPIIGTVGECVGET